MKTSDFQFSNPSLTKLNFQIYDDFEKETGKNIEFTIKSDIKIDKSEIENIASVELTLEIGEVGENIPFVINISQYANFKWGADMEDVDELLSQNAPALLLSYMRPIISLITAASKYPAYNLPYMNFME